MRLSLHIFASEKGVVVENVKFRLRTQQYDCLREPFNGICIPYYLFEIDNAVIDTLFILINIENRHRLFARKSVSWSTI